MKEINKNLIKKQTALRGLAVVFAGLGIMFFVFIWIVAFLIDKPLVGTVPGVIVGLVLATVLCAVLAYHVITRAQRMVQPGEYGASMVALISKSSQNLRAVPFSNIQHMKADHSAPRGHEQRWAKKGLVTVFGGMLTSVLTMPVGDWHPTLYFKTVHGDEYYLPVYGAYRLQVIEFLRYLFSSEYASQIVVDPSVSHYLEEEQISIPHRSTAAASEPGEVLRDKEDVQRAGRFVYVVGWGMVSFVVLIFILRFSFPEVYLFERLYVYMLKAFELFAR